MEKDKEIHDLRMSMESLDTSMYDLQHELDLKTEELDNAKKQLDK